VVLLRDQTRPALTGRQHTAAPRTASEQLLETPRATTKYPGEQEQQGAEDGDPEVDTGVRERA